MMSAKRLGITEKGEKKKQKRKVKVLETMRGHDGDKNATAK